MTDSTLREQLDFHRRMFGIKDKDFITQLEALCQEIAREARNDLRIEIISHAKNYDCPIDHEEMYINEEAVPVGEIVKIFEPELTQKPNDEAN